MFTVLKDICMEVHEKDVSLLIGPNGSGKTTLINCLSGIYVPDEGKILFNGINTVGKKTHELVKLGIAKSFQIPQPFGKLTVAENLLTCSHHHPGEDFSKFILKRLWKKPEEELIQKMFRILEEVGLGAQCNQLASELSGGQLKLLELGRILMLDAKLVLLDEPVGGVNPVLAHKILSRIRKIRDDFGTTFLLVEHRLDLVMQYVDHMFLLASGKIKFAGLPQEFLNSKELINVYL